MSLIVGWIRNVWEQELKQQQKSLGCCWETACDVFCDEGDVHANDIYGKVGFIARTIETTQLYWLLLYNITLSQIIWTQMLCWCCHVTNYTSITTRTKSILTEVPHGLTLGSVCFIISLMTSQIFSNFYFVRTVFRYDATVTAGGRDLEQASVKIDRGLLATDTWC